MLLIDNEEEEYEDEEIRSDDESKTSSHQYRYKEKHPNIFSFIRD